MLGNDYKLIAYMQYTTVGGAPVNNIIIPTGSRNCSAVYIGVGSVQIRVGYPGPITAANTPAGVTTEWSRNISNLLPIVTVGTALTAATLTQVNGTTYAILTTDMAAPGAKEAAIWFGLFVLAV